MGDFHSLPLVLFVMTSGSLLLLLLLSLPSTEQILFCRDTSDLKLSKLSSGQTIPAGHHDAGHLHANGTNLAASVTNRIILAAQALKAAHLHRVETK